MKTALTVNDLDAPSEASTVAGELTDGRKKNIRMAQSRPTDPTVQNGTPNPPMLYRKEPTAGPEMSE